MNDERKLLLQFLGSVTLCSSNPQYVLYDLEILWGKLKLPAVVKNDAFYRDPFSAYMSTLADLEVSSVGGVCLNSLRKARLDVTKRKHDVSLQRARGGEDD